MEDEPLPLPFDTLPHDINKLIGGYLEITDRVEFFRILPDNNDKYTKKLESDKHNLNVKVDLVRKMLIEVDIYNGNSNKQGVAVIKLMNYLLKTKDTCLFRNRKFKETVYHKCCEFTDPTGSIRFISSKRIRYNVMKIANKLSVKTCVF